MSHTSAVSVAPEQGLTAPQSATIAASLLILAALIDSQVIGAVTPQIAAGLHTRNALIAESVTGYSLAAAATALGLGKWGRRVRPGTWLPRAAVVFVLAGLLAAAAPHVGVFFAARVVAGFAGGLISALAIAGLANASSYAARGKQMSGVAVSYFLAPVLGVPIGAYMAGNLGWRWVFVGSSVLTLGAGLLVHVFPLPDAPSFERDSSPSKPEKTAMHSLWELATASRSTMLGIVSAAFVSGGLVGFTTYLGTWLTEAFHAGSGRVGSVYALAGIGAVVGGALGGMLADRFGKRVLAVQASFFMALFLVLLPTFAWGPTLFVLIAAAAFAAALRVAPLQALITELVPAEDRAAYVALRNGASQIGIAGAALLGGVVYGRYGFSGVGVMCAGLTLIAWFLVRRLADPQATERKKPTQSLVVRAAWSAARVAAAVLLVMFLGLPYLLSFAVTKPPTVPQERFRTDTPAASGAVFETVTFRSLDGNILSGWHLPSRGHAVTIILTHGLFRSRYEVMKRGIDLWNSGYGVVMYDLRHHGRSNGEFSTFGYTERNDVLGAVEFVRKASPGNRVVLMGVSMGAAATLMAAAEMKDVSAVVAESSFLSYRDTVQHHVELARIPSVPFASILTYLTAWRMNFAPDDFDVRSAVGKITCPILFIGGTKDVRMPTETVLEPLYAAATNPSKRKYLVEGAKHGHAYDTAPREYVKAVEDFLQANGL